MGDTKPISSVTCGDARCWLWGWHPPMLVVKWAQGLSPSEKSKG